MAIKHNALEAILSKLRVPGLLLHRISDAASFNNYGRGSVVADFFGQIDGHPLLVECKETSENVIYISKLKREESKHQFEALKDWRNTHKNAIAGYLLFFKEEKILKFIPIEDLPQQGSIKVSDESYRTCLITLSLDIKWLLTGNK